MDEPSVQLQLDLKHAVENELATCRPLLHRLHHITYLVQIPRPAHAVRHGSRFYYNILVDSSFSSNSQRKSRDWLSRTQYAPQTGAGTISAAEDLLREIELLASCIRPVKDRKSYDAVEDELSRLETLVDVAVVTAAHLEEVQLRQVHANVPVFAPQEAVDRILALEHFRTVVPLTIFGNHGYKDWRDTTLPPLPEWVGMSLLPDPGNDFRSVPTLAITFNNHHHNGTRASKLAEPRISTSARQKRHAPIVPNESEESAEAILFAEYGLVNVDSQLLSSADPSVYPLAVVQGRQRQAEDLDGNQGGYDDEGGEALSTQTHEAKYCVFERNHVPDKGHGFLAWLIAKARYSFIGGSHEELGEPCARAKSFVNKKRGSEHVELVSAQSKILK